MSTTQRVLVVQLLLLVLSTTSLYVYLYIAKRSSWHLVAHLSAAVTSLAANDSQQQQQEQVRGLMTAVDFSRSVGLLSVKYVAGSFTDRVTAFNRQLDELRRHLLAAAEAAAPGQWQRPRLSRLRVVWATNSDYIQLLTANYSSTVTTLVLPWTQTRSSSWNSLTDQFNVLVQSYYEWTADDRLCSWIETPGLLTHRYDELFNRTCSRNISDTVRPRSLHARYVKYKPIMSRQSTQPGLVNTDTPPYVFYLHIHRNAVVTDLGDVITDGLKLVLLTCHGDLKPSLLPHLDSVPLYDEVYVVTQFWGRAVFHRMVEVMPRLAMCVEFLKANREVRIHGPDVGGRLAELLEIIGLNQSRLVTGTVRAKVVYQPRSTRCGNANVQESQVLSQLYRDYILRTFPPQPRNRLLLIRRSGSRRFTEQRGIEAVLAGAARRYNLTYTMFIDNPTPSLNETMVMFHSAVMVVAPCGAGESNLYFSQPGTYVIEGVCNRPHVNLCFLRLAHILGHHWHGIPSRGGCPKVISVSIRVINAVVKKFLRLWKQTQGRT